MKNGKYEFNSKKQLDNEDRIVLRNTVSANDLAKIHATNVSSKPKDVSLSICLPKSLLKTIKNKAKVEGVSYTRYIRMLLEKNLPTNAL